MHLGLDPLLTANTRVVILGSFPGAASLAAQQYYAHPRNQFWPLLAHALDPTPAAVLARPYAERVAWLLARGVGVWDVYQRCEREGSLDADIRDAALNDLDRIRRTCPALALIAHNGGESARHARHTAALGVPVVRLPSSSPANASWRFDQKLDAWRTALAAALPVQPSRSGTVSTSKP
jgi:TDG/mug DNA glycosylase family protein